jgi:UDP-2,3-diacylglucosamine pyrophosphatase LpxH
VISDLHVGSLDFDVFAFQRCVEQLRGYVKRHGVNIEVLVLLGDNIENTEIFREQVYDALKSSFQLEIAAEIIVNLVKEFEIGRVYILKGQHDERRGVNHAIGLTDKLNSKVGGVTYSGEKEVLDFHGKKIGFCHSVKNLGWSDHPNVCVYGDMHRYAASMRDVFVPGFQAGSGGDERGFLLFLGDGETVYHVLLSSEPYRDTEQLEIECWHFYSDILKKLHPPVLRRSKHIVNIEQNSQPVIPSTLTMRNNFGIEDRPQHASSSEKTRVIEDDSGGYTVRNEHRSYGHIRRSELEVIKNCRSSREVMALLRCGRSRAVVAMRILRAINASEGFAFSSR